VTVRARVRDLVTGPAGEVAESDTTDVHSEVDYFGGYLLQALHSVPDVPRLGELMFRASSRFRAAVNALLTEPPTGLSRAGHSRLMLVLDDLPGALLVSGRRAAHRPFHEPADTTGKISTDASSG